MDLGDLCLSFLIHRSVILDLSQTYPMFALTLCHQEIPDETGLFFFPVCISLSQDALEILQKFFPSFSVAVFLSAAAAPVRALELLPTASLRHLKAS